MSDNRVDILIHIDEDLDDGSIHRIEQEFAMEEGVLSACVHERARHLMLVDYDPECTSSRILLDRVSQRGLHAEVVGL